MAAVRDAPTFSAAAVDAAAWVGGVGPVTSAGEMLATSIGAGILLGGFAGGVHGTVRRWSAHRRDNVAMHMGYLGGLIMAVAATVETILR
jgi:hypothetical protein